MPPANELNKTISPDGKKKRSPMEEMVFMDEMNRRFAKYVGIFQDYQVNPYTKKTLQYVTPKITERTDKRPKAESLPGHCMLKHVIMKSVNIPRHRFFQPQTEQHRYGWFEGGLTGFNQDSNDERFRFSHPTAEFIKTQAAFREYERLMKSFDTKTVIKPGK